VNFGAPNPHAATRAIAQANADVVCLQETNELWEQQIRAALGSSYPQVHFRHGPAASGMVLLSKWPVSRIDFVKPADGWFPACVATVQTPAGNVQFISLHLRPPVDDRGSHVRGYFVTKPLRRAEIEEIYNATAALRPASRVPVIILGDFNESDSGRAVTFLRQRGFRDALHEFDRYTSTWRWNVGPIPLRDRLDHVLYSTALRCFNCRVLKAGNSDHYPIIATFGTQNAVADIR
jgi:endonuclease/exonuclease/phosphatase (EEP) superfamily protein YafD